MIPYLASEDRSLAAFHHLFMGNLKQSLICIHAEKKGCDALIFSVQ